MAALSPFSSLFLWSARCFHCTVHFPAFVGFFQVFFLPSGMYPMDQSEYPGLRSAIERLTLNDSSVMVQRDSSLALGAGWRSERHLCISIQKQCRLKICCQRKKTLFLFLFFILFLQLNKCRFQLWSYRFFH